MGTRADFYLGRGEDAEWLGSIAWDGNPAGIASEVLSATDEEGFRAALADSLSERDDVTMPSQGWPWPWDDSGTTDYAYALDGGVVYASCFGGEWFIATEREPDYDDADDAVAVFPNMAERRSMPPLGSKSSGTILIVGGQS